MEKEREWREKGEKERECREKEEKEKEGDKYRGKKVQRESG